MLLSLTNAVQIFRRRSAKRTGALAPSAFAPMDAILFGALAPGLLLLLAPAPFRDAAAVFVVLGPLVLGLKHGLVVGAWGAGLTAGAMALACAWNPEALPAFPKASAVAGLLAGLLAGRARDRRESRTRQLSSICEYHRARSAQQLAAYESLLLSHADLQRKIGSRCSLRTSLDRVQREIERPPGDGAREATPLAARVLDIFRDVAPLHSAALFLRSDSGVLATEAAATVGPAARALAAYPGIAGWLDGGASDVAAEPPPAPGEALPPIALRDVSGALQGVLFIDDMSFEAVSAETFARLRVLARFLANSLARRARPVAGARDVRGLCKEMHAAVQEACSAELPLTVLAFDCPALPESQLFAHRLLRAGRSLDRTWAVRRRGGAAVVIKLLPLTDGDGASCLTRRLANELEAKFPGARLITRTWVFTAGERDRPWREMEHALGLLTDGTADAAEGLR